MSCILLSFGMLCCFISHAIRCLCCCRLFSESTMDNSFNFEASDVMNADGSVNDNALRAVIERFQTHRVRSKKIIDSLRQQVQELNETNRLATESLENADGMSLKIAKLESNGLKANQELLAQSGKIKVINRWILN